VTVRIRIALALTALPLLACVQRGGMAVPGAEMRLGEHPVILDENGKILAWPETAAPYAEVARLAWGAMKTRFPPQANGLPTFYAYSRFDPDTLEGIHWPHNPAGLNAMLAESATSYFGYSGDREVLALVQATMDHHLEHGTTPEDWEWPRVPFASGEPGSLEYRGADDGAWCDGCGRGDGVGVIEPDKVGELGAGYLRMYEATGEERYRDAAIACADALASHVRDGDERASPWPFRVNAETGAEKEAYSADVIGPIALFDELLRIDAGDVEAYRRARDIAWAWLLAYPMSNDAWSGYFEDIITFDDPWDNPNQYVALQTARYVLEHPQRDPEWRSHAAHLLEWTESEFAGDNMDERGEQFGAKVLSEQRADMAKMASHTARYAAVSALYGVRTGDDAALARAFRSFNWATYQCSAEGIVAVGQDKFEGYWFSDGYGDYIRHFMVGLGAVPEWAPAGESHLVSSTSVVKAVTYDEGRIAYTTFDSVGRDVLRVTARPSSVTVAGEPLHERADPDDAEDGWNAEPLASGGYALRLGRTSGADVVIQLESSTPRVAPAPPAAPPRARPLGGCSLGSSSPAFAEALLVLVVMAVARVRARRDDGDVSRSRP
jgi:hypothetical protein